LNYIQHFWIVSIVALSFLSGCASPKTGITIQPEQGLVLEDTPFYPQEEYRCGPASLAMLLSASGVSVKPDELSPQTYLPGRKGSLQIELLAASRNHGRIPYVIEPDISSLIAELRADRPVLVLQNLGLNILPAYHYAVVIGILSPDKIVLRSGTKRRLVVKIDDFLTTWKRTDSWGMIALRPGELPTKPEKNRYLQAVSAFESSGNVLAATMGYQAACEAWPQNQIALFALGNNYLLQEKYKLAEVIFRKLVAKNRDNIAASNNLAETLSRQGDDVEALLIINRAVGVAARLDSPLEKTLIQTQREILENIYKTE
jgi:hypothetical protein